MISQETEQHINDIIEKQDFTVHNVEKVPINTNGGNYLGDLFEVNVKGKTKKGPKELNLFVKMKINKEVPTMSIHEAYDKEAYFYNELMVKYNELQESVKVPINERYKTAISYGNNNTDAIILQNLAKEGFTTGYRMDCVSLEYAQAAIQQLAKFHGLSLVLKEREPKYFEHKIKLMKYMFHFDDNFHSIYKSMANNALKYFSEEHKKKLEDSLPGLLKKYKYYFEDSESTVFCLCHGDFRVNNMMHRKRNGSLELIPVDYQILHYGCPVLDFFYFITLGTTKEFRKKHLEDLKNLYYDTLTKFLDYFDMDIESVYPRTEFERVYQERYDYTLIGSLFFGTFIFSPDDDLPDVTDANPRNIKISNEGVKRIHDIYYEAVEGGYI